MIFQIYIVQHTTYSGCGWVYLVVCYCVGYYVIIVLQVLCYCGPALFRPSSKYYLIENY